MTGKATHGGPGRGQGRKHVNPDESTARITVRLPQSHLDWLSKQGNISEFLRQLIQEAMIRESQPAE